MCEGVLYIILNMVRAYVRRVVCVLSVVFVASCVCCRSCDRSIVVCVLSVLSKIPKRNGMYVCMYAVVVVVVAAAAAAVIIVIDGRFVVSLWRSGVWVWVWVCVRLFGK